jgi:hypothetical protein
MFRLFSLLKIHVQLGFIMLYSIFIIEDMAKLMENVSRIEETIIASSTAVVDFSTNVVTICHRENTFFLLCWCPKFSIHVDVSMPHG